MSDASETKRLLRAVSQIPFKKIFRERWNAAQQKSGKSSAIGIFGADELEMCKVIDTSLIQQDPSPVKPGYYIGNAALKLIQEFGTQAVYHRQNQFGYHIDLNGGSGLAAGFKFYCHAKTRHLEEISIEFSRIFLKISKAGASFKTPADIESSKTSSENRLVVYAPTETNAAGAASLALKQLPSEWFFPGSHIFGIPIASGIAAVHEDPAIVRDFNTKLVESIMTAYEATKKPVPGLPDDAQFEWFYDRLKERLKKIPHFAGM
ncbi:MAG: hypothetical protein QXM31_02125 [Candidatus Woesearchaeota archaeon]